MEYLKIAFTCGNIHAFEQIGRVCEFYSSKLESRIICLVLYFLSKVADLTQKTLADVSGLANGNGNNP